MFVTGTYYRFEGQYHDSGTRLYRGRSDHRCRLVGFADSI